MYVISDTGATKNYIKVDTPCVNKFKTQKGSRLILPDGSFMQATYKAEINLSPLLSTRSKTAHTFPHLQSGALISIGKICVDGCTATLTSIHMKVEKKVEVVLEGPRKGEASTWNVHLSTTPQPRPTLKRQPANNLMADRTKPDLAQCYHTTLFSPFNHSLVREIKNGYFATWPNLTIDLINKHLLPSMVTAKVHMNQKSKNIKSNQVTRANKAGGATNDITGTTHQQSVHQYHRLQKANRNRLGETSIYLCYTSMTGIVF